MNKRDVRIIFAPRTHACRIYFGLILAKRASLSFVENLVYEACIRRMN
jgi:hypothetical protein